MGITPKEGVNYGGDELVNINDDHQILQLLNGSWGQEEDVISSLTAMREMDEAGASAEAELAISVDNRWQRIKKTNGTTRDDYDIRSDGAYFRKWDLLTDSYKWSKLTGLTEDGQVDVDAIDATDSLTLQHVDALLALNEEILKDKKTKSRKKKEKEAARKLGAREMPEFTQKDLSKDDRNIESLFRKYTRFGFTFDTSMWEGDKVTIVSDIDLDGDGEVDKLTINVDRQASEDETQSIDKWMRDRAVDKGSRVDAHLEDIVMTDEEKEEARRTAVNTFDSLVNSTKDITTMGLQKQVWDPDKGEFVNQFDADGNPIWEVAPVDVSGEFTTVWNLYNLADTYVKGSRGLTPKAEKADLINPAQNPNIATDSDPASGLFGYEGQSKALNDAWEATKKVATDKFLNEYRKEDGSELTQEEKRNFFTEESIVSPTERARACLLYTSPSPRDRG